MTLSPLFHLGVQIHHHNQLHRAIMWADALDAWGNTGHSMLTRDWSRAAESAIWLVGGATGYMVGCSGWWLPGYCHNHCPLWPPSMEEMGRKGELSLFRREERSNWNWMRVSFRNGRYTQIKMILSMKSLLCHESYTAIEPLHEMYQCLEVVENFRIFFSQAKLWSLWCSVAFLFTIQSYPAMQWTGQIKNSWRKAIQGYWKKPMKKINSRTAGDTACRWGAVSRW